MARPSSSRTHDHDRLRFPSTPAPRTDGAEKKESTDPHLSQACRPYATPSSDSSCDRRRSDARTAENKSANSNGVNKSAKVVLGPVPDWKKPNVWFQPSRTGQGITATLMRRQTMFDAQCDLAALVYAE